ncbi:MAG: phytanoyl-CoA dioxygenase family protein [Planctomycetota bacterium]|jgi:ectoine hydroxylase-related dioxygenase (phytanoyl-CoA dioxygenase family)|nr:phytanoyl-CoA dioxygenase family protein [Planctomycetota bacterium]
MPTLSQDKIDQFNDEGYLVIENLVPDSIVDPLIDEVSQTLDAIAEELYDKGEIQDKLEGEGFETRMVGLHGQSDEFYRRIFCGRLHGPKFFQFLTCNEILDVAEDFVGPDLLNCGIYRLRAKLPDHSGTVVNWHQDAGYAREDCRGTFSIAFWIPLTDAEPDRGCIWVIPKAHKLGYIHHGRGEHYLQIDMEPYNEYEKVPVPMKKGDALLLHHLLPHCSKGHTRNVMRWSVDTRYQLPTLPTGFGEAPFLCRSTRWPDRVVTDPDDFARRRVERVFETFE